MNIMINMTGDAEEAAYLPQVEALGAGVELGSYGLAGVRSPEEWVRRVAMHRAVREQFAGRLAVHGPFVGIEYAYLDWMLREAVQRRLDAFFEAAVSLRANRVILHSGYTKENDYFNLQEAWLKGSTAFWKREIERWAEAGIEVVLENVVETGPDLLGQLVDAVGHPNLGLCLDIGHEHAFSRQGAEVWVRRLGQRLRHYHLHDNDGSDRHWMIGKGNIDFEAFYASAEMWTPDATITEEVIDTVEVKMGVIKELTARFQKRNLQG
jgi:sugar phosphate isomerase/epimerase